MSEYPEHEKLRKVTDLSQAIGEFLEFGLAGHGLLLAEWIEATDFCRWEHYSTVGGVPRQRCVDGRLLSHMDDDLGECERCDGTGEIQLNSRLVAAHPNITKLLAAYFDVDLAKIEDEKRAMLASLASAPPAAPETEGGQPG